MEKRLKKYTSIPPSLYVNRSADLQLKRIVDEMQRPGYVLVARQMGKTNLLINAKRTLEHKSRLFVYVDLSNVFKYERECYRNIIDTIIEPNENLFEPIEEKIDSLRLQKLPPHKEYSKSLRIVLEFFKGDIVIILDEIDALRSVDYSDNIFAQIRSNYFSRTNFPVFERLTYILSGVIEPSELIKDRNKSPFNIGDKIYLDDFSKEEHDSFIDKSQLKINNEISNEIYTWTNGNPRLTFDLCSEIEEHIIKGKNITKDIISSIIKVKYLTHYDIAPIDHIRELIKSNRDVRLALIKLQKDINEISDELKNKLYLFGIINSQFDKTTRIKNNIIKESISIEWLTEIENSTKNITVTYGLAKYENKEYQEAIDIFETLLNNSPSNLELETIKFFLGFSYYSLMKYDKALKHLSYNFPDKEIQRKALSASGVCKIASGNASEGYKDLEEVIKIKSNDLAYHNALYNIALNKLNTDTSDAKHLFGELYNSANEIHNEDIDGRTTDEINNLKSNCLYHQAIIELEDKNSDKNRVIELLESALKLASISNSIYIRYLLNDLEATDTPSYKQDLVDSIISNNISFETQNNYPTSFNENHLLTYLGYLFDQKSNQLFEKLLNYSYSFLYNKEVNKSEIIYRSSKNSKSRKSILEHLINVEEKNIRKQVYYDLAIIENNNTELFFEYFLMFKKIVDSLKANDIYVYALAIKKMFDSNKINEGINLCKETIKEIEKINEEVLNYESVIIYYWLALLYKSKKDIPNSRLSAIRTIEVIQLSKDKNKSSMIDEKALKSIEEQMSNILHPKPIKQFQPIISSKKYGRNEKIKVRFKNGKIVEGKYKKLKEDITLGNCIII
jgi:hypothetical protein